MSSHSHVESGEKSKEKKADGNQHNPTPNPILTTQLAHFSVLPHGDVLKTAIPAGVKPLASRPIAPATGISVGTTTATAPKLLGVQGHHTTMPKALGLQQTCASGTQTAAVNLSTQTASSNITGTQPLHIAMTSQSLQSLTPLPVMPALPQAGSMLQTQHFTQVSVTDDMLAKAHEDKEKSRIVMDQTRAPVPASSLMRGTIPQGLQQAQTQVNLTLAPNPGANQSHVSAIQTSINNTIPPAHIPRGAAAASALAAPKIGTNPTLRTSQTISTASQIQQPLLQTLSQSVQLRPLLRPSLPGPQILTTKVSGHHQTDIQRASAHILTSQSTIQGRPVHTQVQPAKSTLTSGQPVVQGFAAQPQKIVTQSQFLAPVTSGTTIVSVTTPKLTGQNIALNLTQTPGGATRTQKVIANQLPTLACGQANIPASLVAGGQTLSLNQSAPQSQKVGSQGALPPGAIVLNTATKQGVPGQRPPKVIMSHVPVTMATSTSIAVTTAAIPKSVFHGNIMTQGMTASTMMATTNIATPTLAKKALVKVPTQRPLPPHVALTTSSHTMEPLHRDMAIQGQTKPSLAQPPGHITQIQSHAPGQVQGNMFTIPATRPPLTNQAVVSLGMSAGQVTMQTETRPQTQDKTIRHGMPPYLSLSQQNCAPHSAVSYCQQQFNVIYQPTFTTGSTIRPSIVPGQPGNIAATLQAAPQGTPAVPPDVRILQPSLVKVDPVNANTITMAQFVAAKTSEAAAIVTTITTPVIQGTALSHQVGGALPPSSYGSGVANQQTGATVSQSTNASPRPSILRKRPHDSGVMIVKKNLLSSVNAVDVPQSQDMTPHVTPTVSPKPPPPIDPNRENSQSSTDTASSAESTPQSNLEARVKDEPMESAENADNVGGLALFGAINNNVEASPRKKPRKQRLEANHEMQDSCSSDEELDKLAKEDLKLEWKEDDMKEDEENKVEVREDIKEYVDEEGVRWTHERRRPPINLLNHYVCTWKTRNNHFLRYSDVKPKEERRPTVNELANQKGIHQKASGWKMYHLAAQLEELMDLERDVFSSMTVVQESIAPNHIAKNPTMEDDISMVHELTQGNIQRCQLVMDQLEEARVSMVKVLDHKQRIIDIINKHHSKRPVKKKERS